MAHEWLERRDGALFTSDQYCRVISYRNHIILRYEAGHQTEIGVVDTARQAHHAHHAHHALLYKHAIQYHAIAHRTLSMIP